MAYHHVIVAVKVQNMASENFHQLGISNAAQQEHLLLT